MKKLRVAIVGAGAIGAYYGARLVEAGVDVTFLLRSDYEHVREHGWVVESVAGDMKLPRVHCAQDSEEIGPVDWVVVAWKTTSNAMYGSVIRPLLHDGTKILTLQNGLGNCERLAALFGADRVFGGLCFICSNRVAPGRIRHTASGQIRVGAYDPEGMVDLDGLVALLSGGGIDCRAVGSLEKAQWMKLIWNIPFNGLAIAEGGVDTAVLLATPGMEARIRKIMAEVKAVAGALGHSIDDAFIDQQVEVTRSMDAYRPSSMIDYVEGREVELDAIWGEPYRRACELDIQVPEIKRLLDDIGNRLAN